MADRITELAIETDIWCDQNVAKDSPSYNAMWESKFAELIIKKCIMIGNYAHDGGEYPGPMIKDYFGIEE